MRRASDPGGDLISIGYKGGGAGTTSKGGTAGTVPPGCPMTGSGVSTPCFNGMAGVAFAGGGGGNSFSNGGSEWRAGQRRGNGVGGGGGAGYFGGGGGSSFYGPASIAVVLSAATGVTPGNSSDSKRPSTAAIGGAKGVASDGGSGYVYLAW